MLINVCDEELDALIASIENDPEHECAERSEAFGFQVPCGECREKNATILQLAKRLRVERKGSD